MKLYLRQDLNKNPKSNNFNLFSTGPSKIKYIFWQITFHKKYHFSLISLIIISISTQKIIATTPNILPSPLIPLTPLTLLTPGHPHHLHLHDPKSLILSHHLPPNLLQLLILRTPINAFPILTTIPSISLISELLIKLSVLHSLALDIFGQHIFISVYFWINSTENTFSIATTFALFE